MKKTALSAVIALALLLPGCGKADDPTASASTDAPAGAPQGEIASQPVASGPSAGADADSPSASQSAPANVTVATGAPLSQRLDCLRENRAVLVVGHRGGPTRDFPENALETLERTRKAGVFASEIDVAESKDGVLFLLHDEELDRTTTGTGLVKDTNWADIQKLKLKTYSKTTAFSPPTLKAALEWAVANNVFLEVDKKRETALAPVIAAIRAAKAENHVTVVTYTDDQAADVHRLAPELVINATIQNEAQLDRLLAKGIKADHLIAWTGNETPNPALWAALAKRGVESAFGTLGRARERLDDVYWEDKDASEYETLIRDGMVLLPTDVSDRVARQLTADDEPARKCGF